MEPVVLTQEKLDQLIGGLGDANKSLIEGRAMMVEHGRRVDTLLKEQEELKKNGGTNDVKIKAVEAQLSTLAEKMVNLADQITNLTNTTRQQLKAVAESGQADSVAYRYRGSPFPNRDGSHGPGGALFASKRQAVELGMYFMATMKHNGETKQKARKWLNDNKADLRYLPQIPISHREIFGDEWLPKFQQALAKDPEAYLIQDLSGMASPGSVLTTPEFVRTLIRNVELHGKFRQNATIWPMPGNESWFPRRVSGMSVYWEGEGEQGTTTDPSFELLKMYAKKAMMLHAYSNELSVDSAIALADAIMFEVSLAFALEEDRIGFNGTGAGGNSTGFAGFFGVLGVTTAGSFDPTIVTAAAGNDLTTEVTEAKLRNMTGQLPTWARAGAKWYMNRTVLADLCAITMGTAGGPVVRFQDGQPPSIMGYPVVEVDQMPVSPSAASTHVFALGDLRRSWILGDRMSPEIETSEHFRFDKDQIMLRAKMRIAFLMAQGNGMVVYKTGTA